MKMSARLVVALALVAVCCAARTASAAPLKEQGLTALAAAGFEEAEIVAKIEKDGIAFEPTPETLERLKQAGVTDAVLKAVESAKRPAAGAPAAGAQPLIAFDAIVALLEGGVDSDTIIARLRKSSGIYTLSTEQEQKLRGAGATDELLRAMKEGGKDSDAPEPISDLAIVFDASASMKEATADGRSKLEVAKDVVGNLVRRIPEGLNVTVVAYGHAPGCSAVKLVRSLSELKAADREPLASQLQALDAVGNTPIALALRQAGEQFAGRKTYCGIVLITDGLESCNGDPSAEAARLAENPMLRFGVNVVGFGLKPAESAATAQIAANGKGKYYDAQNGEELLAAIDEVTKKLGAGAEPAPLNPAASVGKRAIIVKAPDVQMPAVKQIVLTEAEQAGRGTVDYYKINAVDKYDAELRQASAKPVDIWWIPLSGVPVCMARSFENAERIVRQIRPEDYLGMVRVTSENASAKVRIALTLPETGEGTIDHYLVQESDGYNKDLVAPVGTYMLWVIEEGQKPTLLEEEVQVAGGQVTAVQN
jgi:Ca-activated chloride channel family protein